MKSPHAEEWGKHMGTKKSTITHVYIKPDYDQWLQLESWDIIECVYLLNNWHPCEKDYEYNKHGEKISSSKSIVLLTSQMKKIYSMLNRPDFREQLKPINGNFSVEKLLLWADENDLLLPSELHNHLQKIKRKTPNTTREHCQRFRNRLKNSISTLLDGNKPFPSAKDVLRKLNQQASEDIELQIFPDQNTPEKIEYVTSLGKVKTIKYTTFEKSVSNIKKKYFS